METWELKKPTGKLRTKDIRRPDDTGHTKGDLAAALQQATAGVVTGKRTLKRQDILVAGKVFQWRGADEEYPGERDAHILDMANAITEPGAVPLEAIRVLPIGDKFYVVDGHHRLSSYDTAGWSKGIPATMFEGTLSEARQESIEGNNKKKLAMTKTDKSEAAWRLGFEEPDLSKVRVAALTMVSTTTVQNMRAALGKLRAVGKADAEIEQMTWEQVRRGETLERGGPDWDGEAWEDAEANKIVAELERTHIAFMLKKDPKITAMALERLSPGLIRGLMMEWVGMAECEDLIAGWIEERGEPEKF